MILNRVQPSLTLYQLSRKKQEPSNSYSSQQQLLEKKANYLHQLPPFILSFSSSLFVLPLWGNGQLDEREL